jgi:glucokinase
VIERDVGTIIGLDIGGTKTAVVEGDPTTGATLQRHELPTEASTAFTVRFPAITEIIDQTRKTAERAGRSIAAISVSVGGPLRIDEGVLLDPPHLPGWHGAPIRAALSARYAGLPVYVEHDGNAGALAEYRFGVGRERPSIRHLVFLTAGTGLGGGVIANGALLRGASDTAGEFGFFPLAAPDAEGRWVAGSWDTLASGAGLLRHAREMFPARWGAKGSAGKKGERSRLSIRTIVDAALADDPDALAAVERTGEWLGRGLVLVLAAVNPEVVVVGTLGVVLGERLLAPARAILAAQALPSAVAACQLIPSTLGARIGDVAAIMAAVRP